MMNNKIWEQGNSMLYLELSINILYAKKPSLMTFYLLIFTYMKTRNLFLPEDAWKQKNVDFAMAELRRQEFARQQLKVQECVRRLVEAKESHNKSN